MAAIFQINIPLLKKRESHLDPIWIPSKHIYETGFKNIKSIVMCRQFLSFYSSILGKAVNNNSNKEGGWWAKRRNYQINIEDLVVSKFEKGFTFLGPCMCYVLSSFFCLLLSLTSFLLLFFTLISLN